MPSGIGLPDPLAFIRKGNDAGDTAYPTQVKASWYTHRLQLTPYGVQAQFPIRVSEFQIPKPTYRGVGVPRRDSGEGHADSHTDARSRRQRDAIIYAGRRSNWRRGAGVEALAGPEAPVTCGASASRQNCYPPLARGSTTRRTIAASVAGLCITGVDAHRPHGPLP